MAFLYVDTFTLTGAPIIVCRAKLLPPPGFSHQGAFLVVRLLGLALALPYCVIAYMVAGRMGMLGEAQRTARYKPSRLTLFYERRLGYQGTYFNCKIFLVQMFEVYIQCFGKVTKIHIVGSFFLDRGGQAWSLTVVLALMINVAYPAILLGAKTSRLQRDLVFVLDTTLDGFYAILPVWLMCMGCRDQSLILPHDPMTFCSNLVPLFHAHFVLAALETAGRVARAERAQAAAAPAPAEVTEAAAPPEFHQLVVAVPPGATTGTMIRYPLPDGRFIDATIPEGASPGMQLTLAYEAAPTPAAPAAPAKKFCGCCRNVVFWGLTAIVFIMSLFCLASTWFAFMHGLWTPDMGFLIYGCLIFAIPVALIAWLVNFLSPGTTQADDVALRTKLGWRGRILFYVAAVSAFPLALNGMQRGTYGSSCPPCDCVGGLLKSCHIFEDIESVVWNVDGWNGAIRANVLKLANKNIERIRVGAFDDSRFASNAKFVRKLDLSQNDIDSLEPGVFAGLESLRAVNSTSTATPSSAARSTGRRCGGPTERTSPARPSRPSPICVAPPGRSLNKLVYN